MYFFLKLSQRLNYYKFKIKLARYLFNYLLDRSFLSLSEVGRGEVLFFNVLSVGGFLFFVLY